MMYMKEASYTMEKVNDEYKLKEVVDGVAQFVGDSISSTGQGEIIGSWSEPIEINNYYIRKNYCKIINNKANNLPMIICEKTEPESLSLYDYFQKKEMNLTFWDA